MAGTNGGRRRQARVLFCVAAAAATAGVPTLARGADRYWVNTPFSGNANWNNTANWAASSGGPSGASVPGPSDTAILSYNDPAGATVLNPVLNVNASIFALNIGSAGTGTPFLSHTSAVNFLTSGQQSLGHQANGRGAYSHSAGTNTVGTMLYVGLAANARGTYNLSGNGFLNVPTANQGVAVGENGIGVFNHSGGQVRIGSPNVSHLYLGRNAGSTGTYNLGGTGSLAVGGYVYVGLGSAGTFNQTGGTHTAQGVFLGTGTGSSGAYALSAGTLTTSFEDRVGHNFSSTGAVTGTFVNSGGTHAATKLFVGDNRSLTLGPTAAGRYELGGGAAASLTSETTVVGYALATNGIATGSFLQSGGTHATTVLSLGDTPATSGSYTLTAGSLTVADTTYVGNQGSGAFVHSGGSHAVDGRLYVGSAVGSSGSYTLSDTASLRAANLYLTAGTFNQTGGTNNVGIGTSAANPSSLSVGAGTYQLGDGTLAINGYELVGGDGVFTQTAGTHTVGLAGEHTVLAVGVERGTGTFNVGGTGTLHVNGTVQVGGMEILTFSQRATGVFNINGGTVTITDALRIYESAGTAVNFSAGTLNVAALDGVGGRFNWTGGTLNLTGDGAVSVGAGRFFTTLALAPGMTLNARTLAVDVGGTLAFNGGVVTGVSAITLAGGTIIGNAAFTNARQLAGYGTIGGSGAFTNSGAIDVSSGTLTVSRTGTLTNASTGAIHVAGGAQLHLAGANLHNAGTIDLAAGGAVSGTATIINGAGGVIAGSGNITAPLRNDGGTLLVQLGTLNVQQFVVNDGTIHLAGPASRLSGGSIGNNGLVRGDGTIHNSFTNGVLGEIRAEGGKTLLLASMFAPNDGVIRLQGGAAQFSAALVNSTAGVITGRGVLEAPAGLVNNGQVNFVGGISDVYGTVTSNSGSKITVGAGGTAIFYDPVALDAGSEFRVSAGSTAVFFANVAGAGAFTGSGTKNFEGGFSDVAAIATAGDTLVQTEAALTAGHVRENALSVDGLVTIAPSGGGNQGTSTLNELTIGQGGQLDLTDNKLVLRGDDVGSASAGGAYGGAHGLVQRGRNGGAWDGDGLLTSQPDAATGLTTLAVSTAEQAGRAGGTFGGISVDAGDILVMYTYAGDANLDGAITGDDYSNIDFGILFPGMSGYANGDFNYDGVITGDDYSVIDLNILLQGAPFPTGGTASALESSVTAVPEPSACGFALLAAAGTLTRRRRAN